MLHYYNIHCIQKLLCYVLYTCVIYKKYIEIIVIYHVYLLVCLASLLIYFLVYICTYKIILKIYKEFTQINIMIQM